MKHEGEWLEGQLVKAKSYVDHGQTEGSLELLEQLILNKPLSVQQTMIHGDCTTDNVLVINGEVQTFIDVAVMTVGDPRYDEFLAIESCEDNPIYIRAFYDGYHRYKIS
ncbi:phosphotransferase [Paenibacillus crassostreae]|uniref:Aminoglycoside phosphotransferase domain-containing protein n=1 Tax=Paenibacillus crassostreae TaxID=1763538 RepID=A0A167DLY6_9BACL|nr:phosphotransferase [Paenibacillus crassostreae]AOZ91297.1 hypothetical protein LPB68_03150 [Paenibacillus crassostreae]OAB74545.1 hypothetical protein PNBC_10810 [Paenibacillus crassostreae]